MLLLLPYSEYLGRLRDPHNIADIALVFLIVYALLKLVRGTRAAPMGPRPKCTTRMLGIRPEL